MEDQNILTFLVIYNKEKAIIQSSAYDTVEQWKMKIHNRFQIPMHKQIIEGWANVPETDNVILKNCVQMDITTLIIKKEQEDIELLAVDKILNDLPKLPLTFHRCKLEVAVSTACLGPLRERKVLLLYIHSIKDKFSSDFLDILRKPKVVEILKRGFFLLGWDVEDTKFHSALEDALHLNELGNLVSLVESKQNAVLLIVPIQQSVTIYSCFRSFISEKDFIETATHAVKSIGVEVVQEEELNVIESRTGTSDDMDSEKFQKLMADMLGDRDYDGFEFNQHDSLKSKIGFALFGPPQSETGYDDKKKKSIEQLFDIILENSNEIAKYKDKVEISFIYNCIEPLPKEKIARAKKFADYNPKTDLIPLPIFVLRKCHESQHPCRLFIDDTGRVYGTFKDYIESNKLHKCIMVLPSNGRYTVTEDETVALERHLSPACGVDTMVLQGCDYVSTAGGLVSGGIFVAAAIPAITVAPIALMAGGVVGLGVGIYSIGRSAFSLYDKHKHRQSLSFGDSEARGAYLNIVAGSLGFVGAGANLMVSQLVARGVNISKGAGAVVNTIGIVNIGASGASLINSGIDVFDQWFNENQKPSLLTIVQLSSSVLFFGNAVYNFKTCATIVEETQARTLQDYQESLRSNRHRKTFNKLLKATISDKGGNNVLGKAEVIAAVRNIQNKDEVFAVLTRSNKNMNRNGVKFTASNGEIKLNGNSIDMSGFMRMNKQQVNSFLSNLPTNVEVTSADTSTMRHLFSFNLDNISGSDMMNMVTYATKLMIYYGTDVKRILVDVLAKLLSLLTPNMVSLLDEIFPNSTKYLGVIQMILNFFGRMADEMEEQYKQWKETQKQMYYNPIFQYVNVQKTKRWIKFFEEAVYLYRCPNSAISARIAQSIVNDFYSWFAYKLYEYEETKEREINRRIHSAPSPAKKFICTICKGHYYKRK